MARSHHVRRTAALMIAMLMAGACGGDDVTSADATPAPTTASPAVPVTTTAASATTTTAPPTTTTAAPTTTATPAAPLEELGYPVSDEWVVETIVAGLDSATGGLAVGPDGTLYQADFGYSGHPGDRLYVISPDRSTVETLVQSDEMASLTMTRLVDDGTIYQSSYGSNRLFRIDPTGSAEIVAEDLGGPTGIVVNDDGSVFVESYNRNRIYRIAPDGEVVEFVSDARFNGPNGLDVGPDGTLYVADHRDGTIFAVTPEAEVNVLHRFPEETSHLVYLDGSLFVTSRGGYVVFRYDIETANVEIIAGNAEPGDQDGRGGQASFGRPNAITVGPDGALYTNHGEGNANDPVSIKRISHQP